MTQKTEPSVLVEPTIELGHSDLKLTAMGLGCMGMSEFYGPSDDAENVRTLHAALDMGVNFFDTADIYGPFTNEELLGRAFAGRWHELVLATKFGIERKPDRSWRGYNGRPDYVKAACEASLRRLGRDTIDLYYMHRKDPQVPIEETVGAMKALVEAGKVRYLGLSEVTVEDLRRAHAVHPISALQTEYSLWSREPEAALFEVCAELGITFVAYSPLGRGFLTGKITDRDSLSEDDWRRNNPRFQAETMAANQRFVALLNEIAAAKEVTPAQIALAWVHSQNDRLVTIPGTRKVTRLAENLGALQVQFTDEEEARIRAALPAQTAGDRY